MQWSNSYDFTKGPRANAMAPGPENRYAFSAGRAGARQGFARPRKRADTFLMELSATSRKTEKRGQTNTCLGGEFADKFVGAQHDGAGAARIHNSYSRV